MNLILYSKEHYTVSLYNGDLELVSKTTSETKLNLPYGLYKISLSEDHPECGKIFTFSPETMPMDITLCCTGVRSVGG